MTKSTAPRPGSKKGLVCSPYQKPSMAKAPGGSSAGKASGSRYGGRGMRGGRR